MSVRGSPGLSASLVGVLLFLRIVMFAVALLSPPAAGSAVDAARFVEIATTPGRPWRDFPVEYPPLELAVIETLGGTPDTTRDRLAILSFAGDLAAVAAIWTGWGRRTAGVYLLLTTPLLTFLYWRIDPLFVAMTVWGIVLARRRSPVLGGVVLALAALARLWPLVVVPAVGRAVQRYAAAAFLATGGIGVAAWIGYGGADAPWQVLTSRGAQGWSVDGLVGSLAWLAGAEPTADAGSLRVGSIDPWERVVLGICLLVSIAWIWRRGATAHEPAGVAATTAISSLVLLSPLYSIQYVAWILPWAAIAERDDEGGRPIAVFAAGAAFSSGVWGFVHLGARPEMDALLWIFLAKNVFSLAALAVGVRALWRSPLRKAAAGRPTHSDGAR